MARYISLSLCLVFLFLFPLQAMFLNLALGAKIKASHKSVEGFDLESLVDGSDESRSRIYGNFSGSWEIDLLNEETVGAFAFIGEGMDLNIGANYLIGEYKVEYKRTLDEPWQELVHEKDNLFPRKKHSFSPVTARYFRLVVLDSAYIHPQVNEFQIFNCPQSESDSFQHFYLLFTIPVFGFLFSRMRKKLA